MEDTEVVIILQSIRSDFRILMNQLDELRTNLDKLIKDVTELRMMFQQ